VAAATIGAQVLDQAKAEFAQLIGADASDIAVMSCVSDLASSFGNCLAFGPGKGGIVLGEIDFPSLGHADGARRFDTGTPPYICAAAARAGMAMLNGLDMAQVGAHIEHLSATTIEAAQTHALVLASPLNPKRKDSNTAIFIADAGAAEQKMAADGFIVSARGPVIRIAPHLYNTADEVVAAVAALAKYAS